MSKFGSSNVKLRASLFDIGYVPESGRGILATGPLRLEFHKHSLFPLPVDFA